MSDKLRKYVLTLLYTAIGFALSFFVVQLMKYGVIAAVLAGVAYAAFHSFQSLFTNKSK